MNEGCGRNDVDLCSHVLMWLGLLSELSLWETCRVFCSSQSVSSYSASLLSVLLRRPSVGVPSEFSDVSKHSLVVYRENDLTA